jgi:hypothetical protein
MCVILFKPDSCQCYLPFHLDQQKRANKQNNDTKQHEQSGPAGSSGRFEAVSQLGVGGRDFRNIRLNLTRRLV